MTEDSIGTGFYFGAFIDLLAQRDRLSKIKDVPTRTEERATFEQHILETAGVVRNVRKSIAEWTNNDYVNEAAISRLPEERREEFTHIISRSAFQTGFSDCFVVALPLQVDGVRESLSRARAVYGIWMELLKLSWLSLESLAQGVPWRGGLDVGIATEIFPNEIYGPALLSAYTLESKAAEYPRVLTGRELDRYLTFLEVRPALEPLDGFSARMATRCKELICLSDDGWPMLHMLSPVLMDAVPEKFVAAKEAAGRWVREQCDHHGSGRNEMLFRRYMRLARYFDVCERFTPTPGP